jgi:hypothetical protein
MYHQIISITEQTLTAMGISPSEAKVAEGQYNISKDASTEVLIDVWEENSRVFFQAMAPVIKLNDVTRLEVLKNLLEENHGLVEAAFALVDEDVVIKETIDCSVNFAQERCVSCLSRVAYYCEFYRSKWA